MFMIARLNGRGLLFQESSVNTLLIEITEHLMTCGFNVTYAHNTSNEISLLFDMEECNYQRNVQQMIWILAAEASARLTQLLQEVATFDCRMIVLPNKQLVVDYFDLRSSEFNAVNLWSYWKTDTNGIRSITTVRDNEIMIDLLN